MATPLIPLKSKVGRAKVEWLGFLPEGGDPCEMAVAMHNAIALFVKYIPATDHCPVSIECRETDYLGSVGHMYRIAFLGTPYHAGLLKRTRLGFGYIGWQSFQGQSKKAVPQYVGDKPAANGLPDSVFGLRSYAKEKGIDVSDIKSTGAKARLIERLNEVRKPE